MKEGPKDMEGKPEWSVLPWDALEHVVRVFEYGASPEKYKKPYTYRVGIAYSKLFSATIRHLKAWWRGEVYAKDSKCLHLAHVAPNAVLHVSSDPFLSLGDRDTKQ